jgi:hypothetical protein
VGGIKRVVFVVTTGGCRKRRRIGEGYVLDFVDLAARSVGRAEGGKQEGRGC